MPIGNVAIAEVGLDSNLDKCVKCQLLLRALARFCAVLYRICRETWEQGENDFYTPGYSTCFLSGLAERGKEQEWEREERCVIRLPIIGESGRFKNYCGDCLRNALKAAV
ncbi:uncharacterized protein LOC119468705 [Cebus imitator]|uniref:uncharacterized protein LOC119468705 n=1 Tax=Cebus imitator TaxID=2715852 RepID=UPI0018995651|nr:uncharacterized protein LOC119468705 [Cebus imitator]